MTAHLAGNMITIGNYFVQRCLICGEVLMEGDARDYESISVDGSNVPSITSLSCGAFYDIERRDGCTRTLFICDTDGPLFQSDLDVPDNCCVRQKEGQS